MTATEWVWGIDPQISHISFAFAAIGSDDIEVESLIVDSEAREGQRLGWLDRQIRIYAKQIGAVYPPTCIWVEQPSGRFPKPQLYYAVGVIQAALFETLACPVWTIPSSTWKLRTVGRGNASKSEVAGWVNRRDPDILIQHERDAFAIAAAGRAMFTTGQWEASAA